MVSFSSMVCRGFVISAATLWFLACSSGGSGSAEGNEEEVRKKRDAGADVTNDVKTTDSAADATTDGNSSREVFHYRYGNQINGSELVIHADGRVDHGERTCCPPHTDAVTDKNLSEEELRALRADIDAAALGKITTQSAEGGEGSRFGSVTAETANGIPVVVWKRESVNSALSALVTTNDSAAANRLIAWGSARATQKIVP